MNINAIQQRAGDFRDVALNLRRRTFALACWKTRLDRGLTQEQVSVAFGVTECSVTNWELCRTEPEIRYYPKIIEFIG